MPTSPSKKPGGDKSLNSKKSSENNKAKGNPMQSSQPKPQPSPKETVVEANPTKNETEEAVPIVESNHEVLPTASTRLSADNPSNIRISTGSSNSLKDFAYGSNNYEHGSVLSVPKGGDEPDDEDDRLEKLLTNLKGSNGADQTNLQKKKCAPKCKECTCTWSDAFHGLISYFQRLFTFPLARDPISFRRPCDFHPGGGRKIQTESEQAKEKEREDNLEVLCNYDLATKELFEHILKDRKENRAARDNFRTIKVDMTKFPKWNDTTVDRYRSTFHVFDVSGDGFVDFDELNTVLSEFGDKTTIDVRRRVFDKADTRNFGALDFLQFMTMIYEMTTKGNLDKETQGLAESFKTIDRNMARIRSLDVVQQLQAGLF